MPSSPAVLPAGQLALLGRNGPAVAADAPQDLLEALGQVPDPRDPRGRRYPLAPVLAIAVCAVLAGARSYAAIAEWAADAPPGLRAGLGLPGAVPDLATIWRVLTAVDPAALDRAIGAWGEGAARAPAAAGPAGGAGGGRQDRARRPGREWLRAAPAGLPGPPHRGRARPGRRGWQDERDRHVHRPAGPGRRPQRCAGHRQRFW
jgi:DDE_Tnp_1-associated